MEQDGDQTIDNVEAESENTNLNITVTVDNVRKESPIKRCAPPEAEEEAHLYSIICHLR